MGNRKSCPMSRCADKPRPTQKLRSTKLVRRLFAVGILTFGVLFLLNVAYFAVSTTVAAEPSPAGRDLLSSGVEVVPGLDGTCGWETDSTGRAIGMTFLYICLNIWLFLGIAIICDGHFTASLEMICSEKGLNLNNDVAGATFMAAGSSAPELATSFVGTFLSDSNVGVGTIIGSAVFNILVIVGSTALLSDEALDLDWRPVVRDNFFYLVSVIILICVIKVGGDDDIVTIDSVILLIWYTCYILYMAINERMIEKFCPHDSEDASTEEHDVEATVEMNPTAEGAAVPVKKKKSAPVMHSNLHREDAEDQEKALDKEDDLATSDDSESDDEDEGAFCNAVDKVNAVCSWPWEMIFNYTMPDCAYPF